MPDTLALIDFETLKKLSEIEDSPALDRPVGLTSNTLGFLAIDPMEIDYEMHVVLQAGQALEQMRGPEGFNPNTIAFVWPDNQLSLNGLMQVVENVMTWHR